MEQNTSVSTSFWTPRRVALATVVVLLVFTAFYLLVRFRLVFFLLFTAVVLSTAVNPLVDLLTRWKVPRTISVVLIALLALVLLVAFILILVPLIAEQWAALAALLGDWYQELHRTLLESSSLLVRRIARQLPPRLPLTLSAPIAGQEVDTVQMVEQVILLGSILSRNILIVFAVALLAGVWILEGERSSRFLMLAVPQDRRETVRNFFGEIGEKVGAYTRGLAILTSIVGGFSFVAFFLIGLPNALLLGILAGVFELVPLIGPMLGAIPALLVAASTNPALVVPALIASVIIQMLENNIIAPRVMDRTVGVNPIASLLAFLTFGTLFGFVGALLAVPLAAVIQISLNRLLFESRPVEQVDLGKRDAISLLRYEAQNLVQDVRKQVRHKEAELDAGADQVEDSMEAVVQDLDSILAEVEKNQDDQGKGEKP